MAWFDKITSKFGRKKAEAPSVPDQQEQIISEYLDADADVEPQATEHPGEQYFPPLEETRRGIFGPRPAAPSSEYVELPMWDDGTSKITPAEQDTEPATFGEPPAPSFDQQPTIAFEPVNAEPPAEPERPVQPEPPLPPEPVADDLRYEPDLEPEPYYPPPAEKPKRRVLDIFSGFKDPVRRPRYIIWTLVVTLAFAGIMVAVLGVTSTRWFCSEGCHKVQDDTIAAYQNSTHSEISCMACHMPVGATPVTFLLHKAEALGELYLTITNQFELPLNKTSEVARTMASTQCTQCHDEQKRKVTPSAGVIINHQIHADKGVQCTLCHNRIAHNENFKLTLNDPKTGEKNTKHEIYSTMTACFRCHTQGPKTSELSAPGECLTCHPKDFKLKPPSHLQPGFFPGGHGQLAQAAQARSENAKKEEAAEKAEVSQSNGKGGFVQEAAAAEHGGSESIGEELPTVASINECQTCHSEKFCSDCHGVPMPHPASFKKQHADLGKKNPKACSQCHGSKKQFCEKCHHSTSLNYKYDTGKPWIGQHFTAAQQTGTSACFDCHKPTYCAHCHVKGGKL